MCSPLPLLVVVQQPNATKSSSTTDSKQSSRPGNPLDAGIPGSQQLICNDLLLHGRDIAYLRLSAVSQPEKCSSRNVTRAPRSVAHPHAPRPRSARFSGSALAPTAYLYFSDHADRGFLLLDFFEADFLAPRRAALVFLAPCFALLFFERRICLRGSGSGGSNAFSSRLERPFLKP